MTHSRSRHRRLGLLSSLVALIVLSAVPMSVARGATLTISLPTVKTGFQSLTQVTNAGDGKNRLFVVERRGTIRAISSSGALQSGYFLDIRSLVNDAGGEQGLLGVAFHPQFETNRRLYVYFTRSDGDIVLARLRANSTGTRVPASSIQNILRIDHSQNTNHNGGAMAFGPDGYLYLGTGDGGGAGDPGRNAQSKTKNLLGKILRIHVGGSGAGPYGRYSIPSTNPFRGSIAGLNEIWAYGLRNPWRISFDRGTRAFYIADVGQNRYEEINREPRNFAGGRNYGWNVMEVSTATTPRRATRRASGCRSPSTRMRAATARSPVASSTAGRPRPRSSVCTSSPTSAAARSTRCRTPAGRSRCSATGRRTSRHSARPRTASCIS
jgi:glucose/arabinose dehydrogenase